MVAACGDHAGVAGRQALGGRGRPLERCEMIRVRPQVASVVPSPIQRAPPRSAAPPGDASRRQHHSGAVSLNTHPLAARHTGHQTVQAVAGHLHGLPGFELGEQTAGTVRVGGGRARGLPIPTLAPSAKTPRWCTHGRSGQTERCPPGGGWGSRAYPKLRLSAPCARRPVTAGGHKGGGAGWGALVCDCPVLVLTEWWRHGRGRRRRGRRACPWRPRWLALWNRPAW